MLVSALRLAMRPAASAGTGAAPKVTLADHGTSSTGASCVSFRPSGGQGALELDLPPGGVTVTAAAGPPVQMFLRRFGDGYVPNGAAPAEPDFVSREAFGRGLLRAQVFLAPPSRTSALAIPPDQASRPWSARLAATQPVRVCGR